MSRLFLISLLFSCFQSFSQIVEIPDAEFKSRLTNPNLAASVARDAQDNLILVDANLDGEIQVSEALQVVTFSLGSYL